MIIYLLSKILCASNFNEKTKKQNSEGENIKTQNLNTNPNFSFIHLHHALEETHIGNNNPSIEIISKTKNACLQNFYLSSNLNNNDRIYASEIHSQTKINADNPITNAYTKHNDNTISFFKGQQSNAYNFYKSIDQTSSNGNISSNNHLNFNSQNNHKNGKQAFNEDTSFQILSKNNNDEKYYETSKYHQNEEKLLEQSFDFLNENIFQFDEIITNEDLFENQRNAEIDEIIKLIQRDQKLIKEKNEKLKQNIIPLKRARIDINSNDMNSNDIIPLKRARIDINSNDMNSNDMNSNDINSNLANPIIETNLKIQRQTDAFNIKYNIPNLNTDHKLSTTNVKKVVNTNKKMPIFQPELYNQSSSNTMTINFSETTKQTNNFPNIPSTSKTFFLIEKYRTILTRSDEIDSPYDNDFDSPNFSLDFLNSYIAELNKNYLEKCKNIFSVVGEKIPEVLIRFNSINNLNLVQYKISLRN
ncbi:hypothetical protein DMUE_2174 [Dictyocoela muelleri]|nr:hypothetical protein DMUE_2174 [Dictyocoela muelleri]